MKLITLFFAIALLQGCASTMQLAPEALNGQRHIYQQGIETIISQKSTVVEIRPASNSYRSNVRPQFVVAVFNGTNQPFDFSTENIQVYSDEKPIRVFTYDELVQEARRKMAWAAVAAALGGYARTMQAANSGYTYHYGTTNAYAYGSNGQSAYGYGSYSGYSYNAAAAQQAEYAANAETAQEMQAINNAGAQTLSSLASTILKKTTVMPGAWYGGAVTMAPFPDPSQPHEIKVLVTTGNDRHEFMFKDVLLK